MKTEFKNILEQIEQSLLSALPEKSNAEWQELSFGSNLPFVNDSHISVLTEPCRHLISLGGKRWRPLLLVLSSQMVQEVKENLEYSKTQLSKALHLTPVVEFTHTASLIHDDIEDGADTRRGKPCSHITYGMDVAINAASWLYFEAPTVIKSLNASESEKLALYDMVLTELRLLHLGQAMDIKWHRTPDLIPTIDEYKTMVQNKTGTLARLAVKIGFFAGGATQDEIDRAGRIAQDIGVGFQIIDDVTNLTTGNPGKKRGDDIVEGKKSLPVLIHLQDNPLDKEKLCNLFEQAKNEGIDSVAVEQAIELLTKSGAVEKARQQGLKYIEEKCSALSNFYNKKTISGNLIFELFQTMLNPQK